MPENPTVPSITSIPFGFYSQKLWELPVTGTLGWGTWCGAGIPCSRDTSPDFMHHLWVWDHPFHVSAAPPLLPVWMNVTSLIPCAGALSWWSCQSQVAHIHSLLNHPIDSMEEYSSWMQNLMQICCSTCSVILKVTTTQYTCSFNGVYSPHWLVQWNRHCSHICIPVHSPWLPGYINVTPTVLIILTMTGRVPDRPHTYLII